MCFFFLLFVSFIFHFVSSFFSFACLLLHLLALSPRRQALRRREPKSTLQHCNDRERGTILKQKYTNCGLFPHCRFAGVGCSVFRLLLLCFSSLYCFSFLFSQLLCFSFALAPQRLRPGWPSCLSGTMVSPPFGLVSRVSSA